MGHTHTNTNTNTNRLSNVALISTLVAVVLVVIVLSVQASSSSTATAAAGTLSVALSTVAFEEANLLRTGTGTNFPPKMGALLASFTLSYTKRFDAPRPYMSCDKLTGEDAQWKNACMCLFSNGCYSHSEDCKDRSAPHCQQQAAEFFSSCEQDGEEDFNVGEFEECVDHFPYYGYFVHPLVDCVTDNSHIRNCFGSQPDLPKRT